MQGLEKEFEAMVRKHRSTIYSVCYMFSDDKDEVADLFQETLIHLWQGFAKFRGEAKIETWIYRVSMNTCISAERKAHARAANKTVPLTMEIDLFADTDKDTQQVQALYQRIHKLGLVDRAIVMLWLENLSYEEIGQIIGISAKNVSVKLVRIKNLLKQM